MHGSAHDLLFVGDGAAGLRTAIAAADLNPKLSIAIVSKVNPMRSHTVSGEGGTAVVVNADDTVFSCDWLCDQGVDAFVKEGPLELVQLEHWGCL
jgi:fumarate reductase flavoprotein subunit